MGDPEKFSEHNGLSREGRGLYHFLFPVKGRLLVCKLLGHCPLAQQSDLPHVFLSTGVCTPRLVLPSEVSLGIIMGRRETLLMRQKLSFRSLIRRDFLKVA